MERGTNGNGYRMWQNFVHRAAAVFDETSYDRVFKTKHENKQLQENTEHRYVVCLPVEVLNSDVCAIPGTT